MAAMLAALLWTNGAHHQSQLDHGLEHQCASYSANASSYYGDSPGSRSALGHAHEALHSARAALSEPPPDGRSRCSAVVPLAQAAVCALASDPTARTRSPESYLALVNGVAKLGLEFIAEMDSRPSTTHRRMRDLAWTVRMERLLDHLAQTVVPTDGTVKATSKGHAIEVLWTPAGDAQGATLLGQLPTRSLEQLKTPSSLDLPWWIPQAPELGSSPKDHQRVGDSPTLQHLPSTMHELTGAEVVTGPLPSFGAPDPTSLLHSWRQQNERCIASDASLRVLVHNVANYQLRFFGPFGPVVNHNPYKNERLVALRKQLFRGGHDVMAIQEVWEPADTRKLTRSAKEAGYRAFVGLRSNSDALPTYEGRKPFPYVDGLVTFVKEDLLAQATSVRYVARSFDDQWIEPLAHWMQGNLGTVRRGFHVVLVEHPKLGKLAFWNAHQTPFVEQAALRRKQARQLGLVLAQLEDRGYLLYGGIDANGSYSHPHDKVFTAKGGVASEGWHVNSLGPWILSHYAGTMFQTWSTVSTPAEMTAFLGAVGNSSHVALRGPALQDKLNQIATQSPKTPSGVTTDPLGNYLQAWGYQSEPPAQLDHGFASGCIQRCDSPLEPLSANIAVGEGKSLVMRLTDHEAVQFCAGLPQR